MIKNPITNKGEIRYFEILKIFFLLSFLYAFSSTITDRGSALVSQSHIFLIYVLFGLLSFVLSILIVQETLALIKLLQSFVTLFIQFKPVVFFKEINKGIHLINEYSLFNKKIHLRLCVIRC